MHPGGHALLITGNVSVKDTWSAEHWFRREGPLLLRGANISSQEWNSLLITELGEYAMTPLQQLHSQHGHTLLFTHGQRVTVPCLTGRRPGVVVDETANVVWVQRDDQPTASPYMKRDVEVVK